LTAVISMLTWCGVRDGVYVVWWCLQEIARHLRPRSLRALFGRTKAQNAVHCTDLAEDGLLEVEYFFRILDQWSTHGVNIGRNDQWSTHGVNWSQRPVINARSLGRVPAVLLFCVTVCCSNLSQSTNLFLCIVFVAGFCRSVRPSVSDCSTMYALFMFIVVDFRWMFTPSLLLWSFQIVTCCQLSTDPSYVNWCLHKFTVACLLLCVKSLQSIVYGRWTSSLVKYLLLQCVILLVTLWTIQQKLFFCTLLVHFVDYDVCISQMSYCCWVVSTVKIFVRYVSCLSCWPELPRVRSHLQKAKLWICRSGFAACYGYRSCHRTRSIKAVNRTQSTCSNQWSGLIFSSSTNRAVDRRRGLFPFHRFFNASTGLVNGHWSVWHMYCITTSSFQ